MKQPHLPRTPAPPAGALLSSWRARQAARRRRKLASASRVLQGLGHLCKTCSSGEKKSCASPTLRARKLVSNQTNTWSPRWAAGATHGEDGCQSHRGLGSRWAEVILPQLFCLRNLWGRKGPQPRTWEESHLRPAAVRDRQDVALRKSPQLMPDASSSSPLFSKHLPTGRALCPVRRAGKRGRSRFRDEESGS